MAVPSVLPDLSFPSRNEEGTPSFEEYPTDEIYAGTPTAVDFDAYPEAAAFFTAITNGAQEGPNFAGQYTVVSWGCGTSCQSSAIIDAKTGAIAAYDIPSSYGLAYTLESTLLIVNPADEISLPDDALVPVETAYYNLKDGALLRVR